MSHDRITVRIEAFAGASEALGSPRHSITIDGGSTVTDAWVELVKTHPDLRDLQDTIAFARNDQVVDRNTLLQDGDTLALLPPVSGG